MIFSGAHWLKFCSLAQKADKDTEFEPNLFSIHAWAFYESCNQEVEDAKLNLQVLRGFEY